MTIIIIIFLVIQFIIGILYIYDKLSAEDSLTFSNIPLGIGILIIKIISFILDTIFIIKTCLFDVIIYDPSPYISSQEYDTIAIPLTKVFYQWKKTSKELTSSRKEHFSLKPKKDYVDNLTTNPETFVRIANNLYAKYKKEQDIRNKELRTNLTKEDDI